MTITHSTTTSKPNDASKDVSATAWNAAHTIAADTILTGHIKDGEITYADVNATEQFCRINSGQYTGDGAVSQGITGVGFSPKMVWVWRHSAGAAADKPHYVCMDQYAVGFAWQCYSTDDIKADTIISLDADGFTVDDAGVDADPNSNGATYDYLCIG